MVRRRLGTLFVAIAAVVAIAACGSPQQEQAAQPSAAPSGAFPVTIQHMLGTTQIPAEPKRIVALSYEQDLLSQIGVTVVGHNDNAYTSGQPYPWEAGKVDLSGSRPVVDANQQVNLEAVAALKPDLILATNLSSLDQFYPQLSAIAPTVAYVAGWSKDSWQDTATTIGRAVGKEAQAKAVVGRVDEYLDGIAAANPGLRGKRFANAYYYETGKFVVLTDSSAPAVRTLTQLGMVVDPTIQTSVQNRLLSAEQVGLLDVDFLQISFASDALRSELFANPLFANQAVVKQKRFAELDEFGAVAQNYPTVLNIPWLLDPQLPVLKTVAQAAG